ncbi:MAG: hypothetical protein KatS3mg032_2232 [Cyclobacteriaceae bacterium]|nr:MAG: hypothetical protein KatS3mg032_2232 [Cyclobacteriaceae bacterium]
MVSACLGAQPAYKWSKTEALADTLLNRNQVFDAIKLYTRVIRLQQKQKFTGKSVVRFKRALCYYYTASFNEAIADLNIFIAENPEYPRARLLRAYVYRELNEPEKQLQDLTVVLDDDPYNVDLAKWYASILLEVENAGEALRMLQALQLMFNDEEVETNLGIAYYYLNNPDSALHHFNEAIFINGGYFPAYRHAALLCQEQQQYLQSLEYLNLALLLDPDNPELLMYAGIALAETGHRDKACNYLNRAFYAGFAKAKNHLERYCYQADD